MPRKHDRVTYLTEVFLEFASGRREARISDLSAGGCFVECVAALRPGDPVRLGVRMPDGTVVPTAGEITYAFEGMGFGVRFVGLTEDASRRIGDLVSGLASRAVDANSDSLAGVVRRKRRSRRGTHMIGHQDEARGVEGGGDEGFKASVWMSYRVSPDAHEAREGHNETAWFPKAFEWLSDALRAGRRPSMLVQFRWHTGEKEGDGSVEYAPEHHPDVTPGFVEGEVNKLIARAINAAIAEGRFVLADREHSEDGDPEGRATRAEENGAEGVARDAGAVPAPPRGLRVRPPKAGR